MILLGINEGHNATAAIIRNGAVLACASEERFTRTKNDTGYPKKAIDSVLEVAGISCEEIDFVLSAGTFIGSNSSVKQGVSIGDRCVIGMGQQVRANCKTGICMP